MTTFVPPVRYCPVHGEITDGSFVSFWIAGVETPQWCLRCAIEVFEKLGVHVVTREPKEPTC